MRAGCLQGCCSRALTLVRAREHTAARARMSCSCAFHPLRQVLDDPMLRKDALKTVLVSVSTLELTTAMSCGRALPRTWQELGLVGCKIGDAGGQALWIGLHEPHV